LTVLVRKSEKHPIETENDIVAIRHGVRKWALECRFGIIDQTKFVTAASELARNALTYGKGGTALFEALEDGIKKGVRLTFEDHGPGIPDLKLAMTDGYTTGGGLGMGLSGAKRLVNEFEIDSVVGRGTTVRITRWS
jgi:serine/threonine-protein kinase RsbT